MTSGVPDVAQRRIERMRAGGPFGSLFSAPAFAAVGSAGLVPVGEVVGCASLWIGWRNSGCGAFAGSWAGGYQGVTPVTSTASSHGDWASGLLPYVQAYEAGWGTAVRRMVAKAAALGADGVLGVTVTESSLTGAADFVAQGTAVRRRNAAPGASPPWTAGFSAEECAAALIAGYTPAGMVFAMAVATKHEDYWLKQQRRSWTSQPVDGLSELLARGRQDARALAGQAARQHGTGTLVITAMDVREFESPCQQDTPDLHVSAAIQGTVLRHVGTPRARSGAAPPVVPLPVVPLPVVPLSDRPLR